MSSVPVSYTHLVSKALKNLEEEYHLRIFERSSTGMIPTEQGRHFIEQAERVLREVDRLDQSVQEAQERCACLLYTSMERHPAYYDKNTTKRLEVPI